MADNLDTIFPDLDTSDEQDPLGLSVDAKDDTYNSNCQQGTSCLQSHILGTSLEESDMLGTSLQDVENKSHDHTRDADVYDFVSSNDLVSFTWSSCLGV